MQDYFAKNIDMEEMNRYLVRDKKNKTWYEKDITVVNSKKLPPGALDDERGVVTPPFMFVQLAETWDFYNLIILGCLLCSCPDGPRSQPLVQKKDLVSFAEAAVGIHGRRQALRALKYVKDRPASIMEVFVHMFLGLPNHLGGLGLKGGIFNYEVKLGLEGSNALRQKHCYIDYYFPDKKIGYEYQGGSHVGTYDFDSARSVALERLGYKIIPITKSQLYDHNKRKQLFEYICAEHDLRFRIRTKKYAIGVEKIYEALPKLTGKNVASPLADMYSSDKLNLF